MPLYTTALLDQIYGRRPTEFLAKSAATALHEATAAPRQLAFDIFLCHSYLDARRILALRLDFEALGYSVYVDWADDPELDRARVSAATAARLRSRMGQCTALLYASSPVATQSTWMPWGLGYFDGFPGRVAVLPVIDTSLRTQRFRGQEYLGLYPYVTRTAANDGSERLWINDDDRTYVLLDQWLEGEKPYEH